jgi:hypothetical protein
MLATVNDVKAAARKIWPAAAQINVHRVQAASSAPAAYRVSAIGLRSRLLGRMTATTLGELRDRLEHQSKTGEDRRVGLFST